MTYLTPVEKWNRHRHYVKDKKHTLSQKLPAIQAHARQSMCVHICSLNHYFNCMSDIQNYSDVWKKMFSIRSCLLPSLCSPHIMELVVSVRCFFTYLARFQTKLPVRRHRKLYFQLICNNHLLAIELACCTCNSGQGT